jgi:hypothetical protein
MSKPTEGNLQVTLYPGGLNKGTQPPTLVPGFGKATQLPTIIPQPSSTPVPDSAKKQAQGKQKIKDIVKEYHGKLLGNGVYVIPDGDPELIVSLLNVAVRSEQNVMFQIEPGEFTDQLVMRMPKDGKPWLVIGVDDDPASTIISQKIKVPDDSIVVHVEMYAIRLRDTVSVADKTLLLVPDPLHPWEQYVKIAATLLKPDGTGDIVLDPHFPEGIQIFGPRAMATTIGITEEILKDFGATQIEAWQKTVRELKQRYGGEYSSNFFRQDNDDEIFRLITFKKKK